MLVGEVEFMTDGGGTWGGRWGSATITMCAVNGEPLVDGVADGTELI